MNTKIILVVVGEPNSTFSEILFKFFSSKKFKKIKKKNSVNRLQKFTYKTNEKTKIQTLF